MKKSKCLLVHTVLCKVLSKRQRVFVMNMFYIVQYNYAENSAIKHVLMWQLTMIMSEWCTLACP